MLGQVLLISLQSSWKYFAASTLAELYVGVQQVVKRQQFFVDAVDKVVEDLVRHLAKHIESGYLCETSFILLIKPIKTDKNMIFIIRLLANILHDNGQTKSMWICIVPKSHNLEIRKLQQFPDKS